MFFPGEYWWAVQKEKFRDEPLPRWLCIKGTRRGPVGCSSWKAVSGPFPTHSEGQREADMHNAEEHKDVPRPAP